MDKMSEEVITLTRSELNALISKAVEEELKEEATKKLTSQKKKRKKVSSPCLKELVHY